ncbi:MAG: glycosyltransferase family 39 protein [Opitutae bacterium]|nr:glycosyltransferase family 39 protein [Opitutae bacterium]
MKMMPTAEPSDAATGATSAAPAAPAPRWLTALFLLGLIGYAWFLGHNIGAYAGGADSSGYMNNAKLIAQGKISTPQRTLPGLTGPVTSYTFVPLGFIPSTDNTQLIPSYPIGLPLLVAASAAVVGWDAAPHLTIALHAFLGVVMLWQLARALGFSPAWSMFAATLLGACPLYVFFSLQMMSDVPATAWALAAIGCAWRSRHNARWSLAAGFAFGFAVLVRPTNVILALPVACALGLRWRSWLGCALGGIPAGAAFLLYNRAAYGHALASGYGAVGGMFQWEHVPASLANYAHWLPVLLTPFGLLALGLPWCFRRDPWLTATLALWLLLPLALYAYYYHTHETWWYLRFVLPAFPAAWLAALLVGRELVRRWNLRRWFPADQLRTRLTVGSVCTALLVFVWQWNRHLHTRDCGVGERTYLAAINWMRPQVPAQAVLIAMQCSGALFYYTDYTIARWDQFEGVHFLSLIRAAQAAQRPLYALLMPFEEDRVFSEGRLPGRWTKLGTVSDISLWRFDGASAQP